MSAIEPPQPERISGGGGERRDPHEAIIAAAIDLYRACHLPAPTVVIAPSAVEFARIVFALGHGGWLPSYFLCLLVVCSVLALTVSASVLPKLLGGDLTRSVWSDVVIVVYLSLVCVAGTVFAMNRGRPLSLFRREVVIGYGMAGLLGAGAGLAIGGLALLILMAALGAIAAAVVHLIVGLTAPVRKRLAVRRTYEAPVSMRRARPLSDVIAARLRAAAGGLPELVRPPARTASGPARRERPEVGARLESEAQRLYPIDRWPLRPLVGAGHDGTERYVLERAVARVQTVDDLPSLLRAAWALHRAADAVTVLEGMAVVLPADAPLEPVSSVQPARAWRRSQRQPYRAALAVMQNGAWPGVGIDLALSDLLADRLLADHICDLPEATVRHAAIRAMGMDRFMAAAQLRPVQSDASGELYLVGSALDPLAFVKVTDPSPDPDGTARLHWLSVPPHVATAREAVAWTFGLAEQEYTPAAET